MKMLNAKKLMATSLVAAMAVSGLAGCGKTEAPVDASSSAAESQEVVESSVAESSVAEAPVEENLSGEIKFLTNRTDLDLDGTYEKLIAKFNEEYPDVTVKVESITDYAGELAIRMQTNEYGDVLMIPDSVPSSEFGNYFEPFGTVEELSDKYQEGYLYSKYNDGQVYGLAYMCTVQGIVYNKAVFEQAGIATLPTTPDEFLTALQMIKDNTDAIPYYTNANSGWTLDQWEDHTYGTITGNPNYKNNELISDKNAFAEGSSHYVVAKLLYDIVDRGLCEEDPTTCDWEASKGMLNRGEIGCMVLGNWAIQQMKDADAYADNVSYMPFPVTVDGKQYATSGTDYCYAVNTHSENKEAAKAFVQFMVDESGLALASGGISLLKSDPMPTGLENFENVAFIVDQPATAENLGALDDVQYGSGITLYDGGFRLGNVVDIARGIGSMSFEEYMKSLNDAWAAATK